MFLITEQNYIANTQSFFYKITSDFMFLGLFLAALPIIAGAVLRMDFGENMADGKLQNYSIRKITRNAIFIASAGFFMNMITWGWQYTFSWNVLQLVGLSFIIITILLKFFSIRVVFLLGLIALFFAEPLRILLGSLDNSYLIGILIGTDSAFLIWPFFPWFSVIVFGFLIAHYYLKYQDSIMFKAAAMAIGLAFLTAAIFRGEISPYLDPAYVWGTTVLHQKIGWVLASMGLFCILVVIGNIFFNKLHLRKYGIINSYSRGILWIYVVQMFVSYKLSFFIKRFFLMDTPSWEYFILPIVMLLLGWLIGALSIKLLQEKSIIVTLRKI
jgi:hypothetical protein